MWASDFPHADHTPEYVIDLDELVDMFPAEWRRAFIGDNARNVFDLQRGERARMSVVYGDSTVIVLGGKYRPS